MSPGSFRFDMLAPEHDRTGFRCGEDALDRYFKIQVTQDIRRHVANCFVVIEAATNQVAAFYTLSAASISLTDLPPEETKRLPRYPTIPAVRVGRLAVDLRFRRRGLGELMLINAVDRTMQDAAAAFAIVVDAKNDEAAAFYRRFGFREIASRPRSMFLPLATAQKLLLPGE
jgi:ribosomal protein S18 acetylase RimI-like enzyme